MSKYRDIEISTGGETNVGDTTCGETTKRQNDKKIGGMVRLGHG